MELVCLVKTRLVGVAFAFLFRGLELSEYIEALLCSSSIISYSTFSELSPAY